MSESKLLGLLEQSLANGTKVEDAWTQLLQVVYLGQSVTSELCNWLHRNRDDKAKDIVASVLRISREQVTDNVAEDFFKCQFYLPVTNSFDSYLKFNPTAIELFEKARGRRGRQTRIDVCSNYVNMVIGCLERDDQLQHISSPGTNNRIEWLTKGSGAKSGGSGYLAFFELNEDG